MTLLEAVVVFLVIGILLAILLPALGRANGGRRHSCANNLKQLGIAFKMFSDENREKLYPELSDKAGRLMFVTNPSQNPISNYAYLYPEYTTDLAVVLCPMDNSTEQLLSATPYESRDPEVLIDDHSYFYLGYGVNNDAEMAVFAEAYETHVAAGRTFQRSLSVPEGTTVPGNENGLLRLREGIGQFDITDIYAPESPEEIIARAERTTPVMIERPENHETPGGNILYLDGHVEFIPYPGKWPMTEKTIGILYAMDALGE